MQNKQAFIDNWQRVGKESATDAIPEGSYINTAGTGTMSGKEYNDRIAKFRTDLNADPTMRRAGVTVDENGNTVGGGPAAPPAAAPAATAPPAPAPARNTPPVRNTPSEKSNPAVPPKATMPKPAGADGRRVKGSDGNWYWLNAKNQVLGRSN